MHEPLISTLTPDEFLDELRRHVDPADTVRFLEYLLNRIRTLEQQLAIVRVETGRIGYNP
jgi:hypothetical protein